MWENAFRRIHLFNGHTFYLHSRTMIDVAHIAERLLLLERYRETDIGLDRIVLHMKGIFDFDGHKKLHELLIGFPRSQQTDGDAMIPGGD